MPDKNQEAVPQPDASSSTDDNSEQYVPRKALEEVSSDMHKFKTKWKEAEAARNEYEAKLKRIEDERLEETQQYKTLWEKAQQEKEAIENQFKETKNSYLNTFKKMELKRELGGIKDAYLVHADLSQVEINEDGTINKDSVLRAANKFREEYGELIPKSAEKDPTGSASPTNVSVHSKRLEEMSFQEKMEAYRKLKQSN